MLDDILVHGRNQSEYDKRLKATVKKIQATGITLYSPKCEIYQTSQKFLGHSRSIDGLRPDQDMVPGVYKFPTPNNTIEIRRFLGMVNQLGKFISNLAEIKKKKPLRDLWSPTPNSNVFAWQSEQERAFNSLKDVLCSMLVHSIYSPRKRTVLSTDASSYCLGTVLLQQQEDGKVAYASRAMSETET